ncbi:PREDICTED: uncharacterized protein LOC108613262 isoform X4 [Drosophila arizonae]|uniref:Uncharacterized protein LOC108613262 isoform X4 n=1 Tax=Drosophila arizonae TaxID=7263 RepID=A0ABM1P4F8_DROAR|nr:PREDICTED: uncharacterized protein LOC108613262 isoform X4 [Drosophila arizonae]
MSSYRSYAPWKSNLGSSSYKPTSSTYTLGSDLGGGATSRYSSLATPSSYRPSFSGGTYRIKRDPPAPTPVTSYVSRYAKTEPTKPEVASSDRSSPIKRYTGASTKLSKYGRSRDPSPVALEHTNRATSKSRDPSPQLSGAGYRSSVSRNGYNSRYAPSGTRLNGAGSTLDKSISYLTTSDFHARTASRKASREKEVEEQQQQQPKAEELKEIEDEPNSKERQMKEEQKEEQEQQETEEPEETFVSVLVVTRATSPTPPGSTTVQRTRRIDIAKTIEKTIQRSTRKRQMLEKEIQSDRLDDSTRFLRYSAGGSSSISSNYSTHRDRISSLRYSASPQASSSPKSSSPSVESKSNGAVSLASSKSSSKSKLSPPKAVRLNSRQSSVENLVNKPPAVPAKAESPTKSCNGSSSSGSSLAKWPWPNKDFRKSSLNVGPTDRPRQSRTPSSGGESEEAVLERSPSAGSDCAASKPAMLANGKTAARQLKAHKSCNGSKESSESNGSKESKESSLCNGSNRSSKSNGSNGSNGSSESKESSKCNGNGYSGSKESSVSCSTTSACSSSDGEQRAKTTKKQGKKKSPANGSQNKVKEKAKAKAMQREEQPTPESESQSQNQREAESESVELALGNQNSNKSSLDSPNEGAMGVGVSVGADRSQSRLQKLSKVSNFLATRQHDANSEPIFLESSESAGSEAESQPALASLLLDTQTNEPATTTTTTPATSTTTTTTNPTTSPNQTTTRQESLTSEAQQEDTEEPSWWQDTSLQINTASALDNNNRSEMPYRLRHIDSGEDHAWWLRPDEDDTLAETTLNALDDEQDASVATISQGESGYRWSSSKDEHEREREEEQEARVEEFEQEEQVKRMPRSRISPEQDAWWLDDEQQQPQPPQEPTSNGYHEDCNNVEVTLKLPSSSGSSSNKSSQSSAAKSPSWWQAGPAKKLFNVQRVESGERAWWQEQEQVEPQPQSQPQLQPPPVKLPTPPPTPPPRIIKPWDSGERAWWLEEDQPEQPEQPQATSGDQVDAQVLSQPCEMSTSFDFAYSVRPNPLGQCASPLPAEQIEQIDQRKLCASPYDNIPMSKVQMAAPPLQLQSASQSSPMPPTPPPRYSYTPPTCRVGDKLFISRHQNIDELLGGACRPLSPLFYSGGSAAESEATALPLASKNMFLLEEITPDQVRIHDSTAQLPVIQRMQRDVEWLGNGSSSSNFYEQQKQQPQQRRIDDAAIQVYKDGDFGAYLDLESSLAEQSEEIEGLQASRKNSLVIRTQLSVRVHAIIEKLLSSEGSDLRRALFSLKQVFQEDKDLVHAFVALGGLNCLVRVGNCADQNYQNYILRALGQVMLYVDGMNGVMKHQPTMEWLYSLIASNYRSVVKTALKLLLVFVEYAETNCYVLVSAIHAVDAAQGTLPWANIMRLLKDYDNADAELVIYATSLINKTLAGLTDQDSFYDESDLLEQQGMETVIQRYMSKPGTDLDLLDQLQLYEAVLKFEDGESDGQRLPQNSMRKTQRYRPGASTTERRKSRRHSTDNSPAPLTKVLPTQVLRMTPTQATVDEDDSSGSTNSTEFSNGIFQEKKPRDGAGVTPGLRRRRERAERHKSFLKEQEEAAANGIFAARELRESYDLEDKEMLMQLKRDHTVKDLTQKLCNLPTSPTQEPGSRAIVGDMSGLISKAKEGLAKSKSKGEISRSSSVDQELKKAEPKKSENELHWEELVRNMTRPLNLCDLDFTDLHSDDEKDVLAPRGLGAGIPPPPPPLGGGMVMPPPMMPPCLMPPPMFSYAGYGASSLTNSVNSSLNGSINGELANGNNTIKKNKKTVKLFWKEVREDMIPQVIGKTIWDELPSANVDTQKLEHLFESRAKDLMTKKQQELNKSKEIIVLDHKRSNAINIAMTKLPPPRAIKAAILKMDATVVTREGIDKLLNMLPTDEERGKIQEAQLSNPELPLGSAEQFLLTLASITELGARLKLWAFRLDFDNCEKEIAEPLMDLKQGIEILRHNRTFRSILATLLSVGIFLNGAPVKGFQIEYLAKVPEVKDTVHKHSLLHHLCHMVMESNSDTTDLYSEIGPITRASKADFADLAHNLTQLESECKASWDRLKLIAKHDCAPPLKQKLVDFLADCAERIISLQTVHRRVMNRYRKFLLWLGMPQHSVAESRPNEFCRTLSEFALEYRTTRERVQQQLEKKANHRERNKTRGKLIIDMVKFKTKEDVADAELKQLLGTPSPDQTDGTLTWRRRRAEQLRSPIARQSEEQFTDGDDEILESLVKTATKASGTRTTPRERKRTRHADRKSLRRTLKNGLTEEEKQHVAALIQTY